MIDQIDGVILLHCWRGQAYQRWFDKVIQELSKATNVNTVVILNGRFDNHDWIHGWVQDKIRLTVPDKRWVSVDVMPNNVKNWLLIGQTWDVCVHDDQLGLNKLSKFPGNIYITPWSIFKTDYSDITQQDIDNDPSVSWKTINNFGWKLIYDK